MRASILVGAAAILAGCGTPLVTTAPPTPLEQAAPRAMPTTPPQPGPAPSLRLPSSERRSLANGLQVVYVPRRNLPIVSAALVTRGGTSDDPADAPGLAEFVADMMDEGAGGRDALELAAAVEALGASLSVRSGRDAIEVEMEVLRPRLSAALALMADVVARPDFPTDEIERKREELLTDLARARDEARIIAGNAFASLVYGADHPYGRLPGRETAAAITRADMVAFHHAFVRPEGATLVLVGDVSAAEAHAMVEDAFGGWARGSLADPPAPPAPSVPATTIYLVDKPGAPQSEVRIGHPGVARDDPDYFTILVLNTILGGSFTSRLNSNLREEHGYSYGARSSFAMLRGAGAFQASAAVVSEKTDSSVVEFFRELERIREETVPPAELERAKNYVALGLPRRFETTGGVAGQLADLAVYGISEAFYADYVERVLAVTAADVQRVAQERIRPQNAVVVIVGDRAAVEEGLRGLNIGPVEVRPVEEFVR